MDNAWTIYFRRGLLQSWVGGAPKCAFWDTAFTASWFRVPLFQALRGRDLSGLLALTLRHCYRYYPTHIFHLVPIFSSLKVRAGPPIAEQTMSLRRVFLNGFFSAWTTGLHWDFPGGKRCLRVFTTWGSSFPLFLSGRALLSIQF